MLTLVIGDLFVPDRAIGLPSDFKKLLSPNPSAIPSNNKIAQVLCLGNVTNSIETLQFLYNLSPSFHMVRGEYDDAQLLTQQLKALGHESPNIPFHQVVTIDNLKIGFTSGYQILPRGDDVALLTLARELNVDILIWGGTHKVEAYAVEGKFFINPGSATGAHTFGWADPDKDSDDEAGGESELDDAENDAADAKLEQTAGDDSKEGEESGDQKPQNEEPAKAKLDLFGEETADASESLSGSASNEIDLELLNKVSESTSVIPSFCLLDSQGSACTLYIYTYLKGEVKVNKVSIPRNN
ncbi:uncharacterized protein CANTADRAFT_57571 [Suhomyces tanzawaensis NRRL Y-17324]|uniref:Vacuolar protein sorting-associated protein 29 n=1 Tax=Suhomyces tanzawaensis NRRL Y-17324 TaxID=984487 RepID=A0A1E4SBI7_9ASCO|nr:uncharacterized protein CANTADRAFT_57571 [Suhomyces tanzawaensis NRRL Y-17324]ODV76845.1 hypothetical protein CANTADRAFT_57571 [Suhomyces tanzawaensis NRRL Y-17324]